MEKSSIIGVYDNVKGKVKDTAQKITSDKPTTDKITGQVKDKDFKGAANTAKEKLQNLKETDANRKAS